MTFALAGALALASDGFTQEVPPEPDTDLALRARVVDAMRLPELADRVRAAGVAADQLRAAIEALRDIGAAPADLVAIFVTTEIAIRQHGPIQDFGAFIQARLAEGIRGRGLTAAIRNEFAINGQGPVPPTDDSADEAAEPDGEAAEPGGEAETEPRTAAAEQEP